MQANRILDFNIPILKQNPLFTGISTYPHHNSNIIQYMKHTSGLKQSILQALSVSYITNVKI